MTNTSGTQHSETSDEKAKSLALFINRVSAAFLCFVTVVIGATILFIAVLGAGSDLYGFDYAATLVVGALLIFIGVSARATAVRRAATAERDECDIALARRIAELGNRQGGAGGAAARADASSAPDRGPIAAPATTE